MAYITRKVVGRNDDELEPCVFLTMANDKVSLMAGVHFDETNVSRESNVGHELFSALKQRFPVKHQGS